MVQLVYLALLELQNSQWMYLNGVILVSPTDIGIERDGPVKQANQLPYFAAAAWYHDALPDALQSKDLEEMLPEVERFALEQYLPALAKGAMLTGEAREQMAERVAYYSGLSNRQYWTTTWLQALGTSGKSSCVTVTAPLVV